MLDASGTAMGPKELTPEEWVILKDHLTIFLDHDKDTVEIGWGGNCGVKSCTVPHSRVVFYSCPSKPCPR
jgi:hypothetical protein